MGMLPVGIRAVHFHLVATKRIAVQRRSKGGRRRRRSAKTRGRMMAEDSKRQERGAPDRKQRAKDPFIKRHCGGTITLG